MRKNINRSSRKKAKIFNDRTFKIIFTNFSEDGHFEVYPLFLGNITDQFGRFFKDYGYRNIRLTGATCE